MRNLYLFNMTTVDGYFEGTKKWEIDWHNVDDEFNDFAIKQLDATGTLMFGRVTYEGMAGYWPTQRAIQSDPDIAERMNSIEKVVVSTTLRRADWENTRIVHANVKEEIRKLKGLPGKEIGVFGSANLADSLINSGLVDECRIIINPIALGKGNSLFKANGDRTNLRLLGTTTFKSGNVLLRYGMEKKVYT